MTKLLFSVAAGAVAQEFIHWYGLRMNVSAQKYLKILHFRVYWLIIIAMVALSLCVGFIFLDPDNTDPKAAFIFGLTLPAFLKQIASIKQAKTHLGADDAGDIFKGYLSFR